VIPIIIFIVDLLARILIFLLIIHVILTYFLSPFHPIRQRIDQVIVPLLNPIRRIIPSIGMFDFSPLILILLIEIINLVIRNILMSFL